MLFWGLLAAYRAACDFLLLLSQEKEAKEGNPATRVPSLRCGRPAVLDHRVLPQNLSARFSRFTQTAAASLSTMQMRPAAHLRTLCSVCLGTGRRGLVQVGRACCLDFLIAGCDCWISVRSQSDSYEPPRIFCSIERSVF